MKFQEHFRTIKKKIKLDDNLMKYKKEYMAKKMTEDNFKKNHTFAPDTKLTKGKVIPKHP